MSAEEDFFDRLGRKMANAIVETCKAADGMTEPFRSGAITAMEEFSFRFTGHHFDWETFKMQMAAYELKHPTSAQKAAVARRKGSRA